KARRASFRDRSRSTFTRRFPVRGLRYSVDCTRSAGRVARSPLNARDSALNSRLRATLTMTAEPLLNKEKERALIDPIRRLLALPMNKRTNFLRVRRPGGGSHL